MSKNMRIALPVILVLLVVGLYLFRDRISTRATAGTPDASVEPVKAAGLGGGLEKTLPSETPAAAPTPTPVVTGSPGRIPACGNCKLNPVTGALTLQFQPRFAFEEALNWTVQGVEIIYTSGAVANPPLKADGSSPTITAADVNCSATKNMTVNMSGISGSGIKSVNLRLKSAAGIPFKRMCVKMTVDGQTTVLEKDCNCCNCGLCTDVGTCQP